MIDHPGRRYTEVVIAIVVLLSARWLIGCAPVVEQPLPVPPIPPKIAHLHHHLPPSLPTPEPKTEAPPLATPPSETEELPPCAPSGPIRCKDGDK